MLARYLSFLLFFSITKWSCFSGLGIIRWSVYTFPSKFIIYFINLSNLLFVLNGNYNPSWQNKRWYYHTLRTGDPLSGAGVQTGYTGGESLSS